MHYSLSRPSISLMNKPHNSLTRLPIPPFLFESRRKDCGDQLTLKIMNLWTVSYVQHCLSTPTLSNILHLQAVCMHWVPNTVINNSLQTSACRVGGTWNTAPLQLLRTCSACCEQDSRHSSSANQSSAYHGASHQIPVDHDVVRQGHQSQAECLLQAPVHHWAAGSSMLCV